MNRFTKTYSQQLTITFKNKLLHWAQQFDEVVWLDGNNHNDTYGQYRAVLAVDGFTSIKTDLHVAFDALKEYQLVTKDWIFGYLTYDLKNDLETLSSVNYDGLKFPDLYFFQPKRLFLFTEETVEVHYLSMVDDELEFDWQAILNVQLPEAEDHQDSVKIRLRTSKDSYFEKVGTLLKHIERGDVYEANFCQEFYSEEITIDPLHTFLRLNELSKPPFATFLKLNEFYALSASPERYICKQGNKVVSQPIKGTAKRLKNDKADQEIMAQLRADPKERSENIMITDLVRNDLSKFAKKGSVKVEELCEIYTFEQVHQMISTISCEVDETVAAVDILRNTFPMGSMTGAPKVSAMKIIEKLEDAKRGLYSGSIGYFTPTGDFDFNVIIRSILYNEKRKYLSFSVGGAITANSIIEKEYEECLLKAKAMRETLERT